MELQSNPNRIIRFDEWNEGSNVWIKEFVALPNYAMRLARKAKCIIREFSVSEINWLRTSHIISHEHKTLSLKRGI
jgi:hypothetical protein